MRVLWQMLFDDFDLLSVENDWLWSVGEGRALIRFVHKMDILLVVGRRLLCVDSDGSFMFSKGGNNGLDFWMGQTFLKNKNGYTENVSFVGWKKK